MYSKKKHLDFTETELAVFVLDNLKHRPVQIKRERQRRSRAYAHAQAAPPGCDSPGWVATSPRA